MLTRLNSRRKRQLEERRSFSIVPNDVVCIIAGYFDIVSSWVVALTCRRFSALLLYNQQQLRVLTHNANLYIPRQTRDYRKLLRDLSSAPCLSRQSRVLRYQFRDPKISEHSIVGMNLTTDAFSCLTRGEYPCEKNERCVIGGRHYRWKVLATPCVGYWEYAWLTPQKVIYSSSTTGGVLKIVDVTTRSPVSMSLRVDADASIADSLHVGNDGLLAYGLHVLDLQSGKTVWKFPANRDSVNLEKITGLMQNKITYEFSSKVCTYDIRQPAKEDDLGLHYSSHSMFTSRANLVLREDYRLVGGLSQDEVFAFPSHVLSFDHPLHHFRSFVMYGCNNLLMCTQQRQLSKLIATSSGFYTRLLITQNTLIQNYRVALSDKLLLIRHHYSNRLHWFKY